jgi:hypothetical protein
MKVPQLQHAASLVAAMHRLDARAAQIERDVETAAIEWMPPGAAWSVGQVFEHLCVANDDYLVVLRRALSDASRTHPAASAETSWRSSFAGGILARSMMSPRKLRAPKAWVPAPHPRPNVIAEFLARQREIVQLIERSSSLEWRRIRLASPVSSLVRMNVGDAFTILVRHAERHFRQIDERLAAFAAERSGQMAGSR